MSKIMQHGDYIDRAEIETEEQFDVLCAALGEQGLPMMEGMHSDPGANCLVIAIDQEMAFWGRHDDRYTVSMVSLADVIGATHD